MSAEEQSDAGAEKNRGELDDAVRQDAQESQRLARRDILDQHGEIQRFHEWRTRESGGDAGAHAAAEEWCASHAAIWRAERESLERNGFRRINVVVRNPDALHLRPWSAVAATAARFDCDIYVHRPGMSHWNFLLEGRPFMNVKSVVGKVQLGEADAGIVYRSDVTPTVARFLRVFELPEGSNAVASYPIAVLRDAPDPAAARAFVAFVLSPEGQAILASRGLVPAATVEP